MWGLRLRSKADITPSGTQSRKRRKEVTERDKGDSKDRKAGRAGGKPGGEIGVLAQKAHAQTYVYSSMIILAQKLHT